MSDFYSVVILLAVLIMVIMDLLVSSNDLLDTDKKQTVYTISVLVIAGALSEWLGVLMNGALPALRPLHLLVKALELSIAPVITALCVDLISPIKHKRLIPLLLALHTLLEAASALGGDFIFSVDAQNIYRHESFYWVFVLTYVSGVVLFMVKLLREGRNQYGMPRALCVVLPVFFFCGMIVQYCLAVRILWLCSSVDILMAYILYSELTQKIDAVTHLLNRRSYESRLSSLREHAVIFYFDVDKFKTVNDTYGHCEGDNILADVGAAIYAVFSRAGFCYRIGGDEFCAIVHIADTAAEALLSEFLREMTERRAQNEHLPHVSVGYACYHPQRDSIDDVIARADRMMYHYKRKLHTTAKSANE